MAQKSNIRSMRFSNEIIEMIERQAGESFTAKFENLVTRCVWELQRKEEELKKIEDQIIKQRGRLSEIKNKLMQLAVQLTRLNTDFKT